MEFRKWHDQRYDPDFLTNTWNDFLKNEFQCADIHMIYWFCFIARQMMEMLSTNNTYIKYHMKQIKDGKYKDQFTQFQELNAKLMKQCESVVLRYKGFVECLSVKKEWVVARKPITTIINAWRCMTDVVKELPSFICCQYDQYFLHDQYFLYDHTYNHIFSACRTQYTLFNYYQNINIAICPFFKKMLVSQTTDIVKTMMERWMSDMYYVRQMYNQNHFRLCVILPKKYLSFTKKNEWQTICESEDEILLNHPMLPHPSDFILIKKNTSGLGNTYVEKARFHYAIKSIKRNINQYAVCFNKHQQIIPMVIQKPETNEENRMKTTITEKEQRTQQTLYKESILSHQHNKIKKKKKGIKKITKEKRKQLKTQYKKQQQQTNTSRCFSRVETGPEYDDDYTDNNNYDYDYDHFDNDFFVIE